jgi:hypothetical protein
MVQLNCELKVDLVRVVAEWGVGSVSVDLLVLEGAPRSPVGSGVVPVDATVVDELGSLFGEILLWVTDGYLSAIEYAWYGDESPRAFPNVALITTDVQSAPSQRRVGDGSCEPIAEGLGW